MLRAAQLTRFFKPIDQVQFKQPWEPALYISLYPVRKLRNLSTS